jgi:hypothetical protein
MSPEEVYSRWLKHMPSRQHKHLQCNRLLPLPAKKLRIKPFIKVEGMGKSGPRNICPLPPEVLTKMGPLVYRCEKALSCLPCLFKGMTIGQRDANLAQRKRSPALRESQRLHPLLARLLVWMAERNIPLPAWTQPGHPLPPATVLAQTDFSKFDRTIAEIIRQLECRFSKRMHTFEEYLEFDKITGLFMNAIMQHVSGFVVKLPEIGSQRLSGEPGTSIWNAMAHLFVKYLAHLLDGYDPDCFSACLDGVCVEGDDGLDFNYSCEASELASQVLGFELKCEPCAGIEYAGFLGRHHGVGLDGKLRSIADFTRTMRAFDKTSRPRGKSGREGLLAAKSLSYLATDYHTPVISAMAWACLQMCKDFSTTEMSTFKARYELRDVNLDTLRSCAPPPFDHGLAATVSYHSGFSIGELEIWHGEFIKFGKHLGPWPRKRAILVPEGEQYMYVC